MPSRTPTLSTFSSFSSRRSVGGVADSGFGSSGVPTAAASAAAEQQQQQQHGGSIGAHRPSTGSRASVSVLSVGSGGGSGGPQFGGGGGDADGPFLPRTLMSGSQGGGGSGGGGGADATVEDLENGSGGDAAGRSTRLLRESKRGVVREGVAGTSSSGGGGTGSGGGTRHNSVSGGAPDPRARSPSTERGNPPFRLCLALCLYVRLLLLPLLLACW